MNRRSVEILAPTPRELEINGEIYEIQLTDLEVIALAMSLEEKIADLAQAKRMEDSGTREGVYRQIIAALDDILAVTDRVLGEGATKKILGGRRANINYMLERVITPILQAVLEESMAEYDRRIEHGYE